MKNTLDLFWILKDKKPIQVSTLEWAEWFQNRENRIVKNDQIEGNIFVSTIFLGLDHGFGCPGPPVLFETMIFGGPHHNYQDRYCTWEQAEEGHAHALELAIRTKPDSETK